MASNGRTSTWPARPGRTRRAPRTRRARLDSASVCSTNMSPRCSRPSTRCTMQVDFYQLGGTPAEQVIASIAEKVLAGDGRLLIVGEDEGFLARLDRMLWDTGPTSFLPHALAGGPEDARQPVLLSASADAPNRARNMLIADGQWRDSGLTYDR